MPSAPGFEYRNLSERFKDISCNVRVEEHYRSIYRTRLDHYQQLLRAYFERESVTMPPQYDIPSLSRDEDRFVVGIIYRQSSHKASILKDIAIAAQEYVDSDEPQMISQLLPTHVDDEIWLEDQFQRVQLNYKSDILMTGVPCAAFGRLTSHGKMDISKMLEGCPPQPVESIRLGTERR
ncbi:hypothetical protein ACOME3_002806 [Neoechinorhynchus agilis]